MSQIKAKIENVIGSESVAVYHSREEAVTDLKASGAVPLFGDEGNNSWKIENYNNKGETIYLILHRMAETNEWHLKDDTNDRSEDW